MKVRTDFHGVDLAKGTKTRSVVGDGERVDETIGSAEPSGEPYEYDPRVEGVSGVISNRTPAPDWAEKEAREFDVAIGTTLKCKCGTTDLAYHCRLCFQDSLAALLRRVREEGVAATYEHAAQICEYQQKFYDEERDAQGYNALKLARQKIRAAAIRKGER